MRILIVSERFFPEVGAAPTRLKNMLDGFKSFGNNVDVLTSLPNYPKGEIFEGYKGRISVSENIDNSNIYRYWTYATISPSPVKRAINMISFAVMIWLFAFRVKKCKSYDRVIIQTPTLFAAVSSLILFRYVYRKKCFLNVSDIWPSTAVDMGAMRAGSLAHKVMLKCEKFLYLKSDAILGQSKEILEHIHSKFSNKSLFLYRNLQKDSNYSVMPDRQKHKTLRLVFAGMLGVAQNVYEIVQKIDFSSLNVEFHIYGMGNQYDKLLEFSKNNPNANVFVHGSVPKEEMNEVYSFVDVAIVPLCVRIYGAFPSKIYDILPMGLPILFCGDGEPAKFIMDNNIGFVSKAGDYKALEENIIKFRDMDDDTYGNMCGNCIGLSQEELNFETQIKDVIKFLKEV